MKFSTILITELVSKLEHQLKTGNTENPEVFLALAKAARALMARGE